MQNESRCGDAKPPFLNCLLVPPEVPRRFRERRSKFGKDPCRRRKDARGRYLECIFLVLGKILNMLSVRREICAFVKITFHIMFNLSYYIFQFFLFLGGAYFDIVKWSCRIPTSMFSIFDLNLWCWIRSVWFVNLVQTQCLMEEDILWSWWVDLFF